MAHDFLGTFNKSQFERFLAFARSQLPLIDARILHLNAELARVGIVIFRYDDGVPLGYAADPPQSYLGKMLAAYEVLGGNPFRDLRVRLRTNPVFIRRGDVLTDAQTTSGGEPLGGRGLMDGPTAGMMQVAKGWLEETARSRFNRLERKIRRAMDYTDQLQDEITDLNRIRKSAQIKGSLEYIASQIEQFMTDSTYRAIYDDEGKDPEGRKVYAQYSSYDVEKSNLPDIGGTREITGGGQRGAGGYKEAGKKA